MTYGCPSATLKPWTEQSPETLTEQSPETAQHCPVASVAMFQQTCMVHWFTEERVVTRASPEGHNGLHLSVA